MNFQENPGTNHWKFIIKSIETNLQKQTLGFLKWKFKILQLKVIKIAL